MVRVTTMTPPPFHNRMRNTSRERPLDKFLELTRRKPGDSYVHITIHNVSGSLLKEFMRKVVKPNYPGGISPAIKDLMWKAVKQQRQKEKKE
jgi:hypothetical protein